MRVRATTILLSLTLVLHGQVPVATLKADRKEDPFIKYIGSISSKGNKDNIGFFEKIFNIIVGFEPVHFNNPVNMFASGNNNCWIINQGNGSILHYLDGKTERIDAFKKNSTSFTSLVGITQVGTSGILFTDSRLNKVYLLSEDEKQIRTFSDTNSLLRPTGIAYSEKNYEVWVVETGSHCVSVFDLSGKRIKTIGRRGNGALEFNFPTYIWIDKDGRIYIVDSMNFRVQILSSKGEFISAFGKQGDATGSFARPRGIATDSHGNIYVVDALFNAVQIFDSSGRLLYYFGSQGNGDYQFWMPSGIFIDKSDFIYIADSYNARVQVYQFVKNDQK
jgi:DNA-binding beta-propeller fold protein YncE